MLDTSSGEVLTAMHGQGEWDPDRTASSVDGFFAALEAFRELASVEGREDPESEPVPRDELDRFLAKVREADPGADLDWWTGIIYAGEEPPAA